MPHPMQDAPKTSSRSDKVLALIVALVAIFIGIPFVIWLAFVVLSSIAHSS